jgi:hypothetical protein
MTLVLELDAETENRLRAQADARGVAVEAFGESVLRKSGENEVQVKRQTVEGFEAMLRELAKGSESRPVLPPEVFERESFYEDRW